MSLTIPKEHQTAGQIAILATAVLWSTSGLFIKLIPWHPMVIAGGRCFLAAIFLLAVRFISPPPKNVKNEPFPLWAGAIAYSLTMITFIYANKLTTSANAIVLQYGAPVWAALLGWKLNKERPHWEQWGALVLVIGGLLLFFRDGLSSGALLGDILAILSGIVFGANSVFLRMMKDSNPRDSMLLAHVITVFVSIPFIFIYPAELSAATLSSILYMGLLQIGLASLLFAYGLKRISAVQAMIIAILEPVLNPIWVLLVIGEKPSSAALTGGTIIISAIVVSSIIRKRREDSGRKSLHGNTSQ